jgi:hypothetical protein
MPAPDGISGRYSYPAPTNRLLRAKPIATSTSWPQMSLPLCAKAFGVGSGTAAQVLVIFGDNPERIHSKAACAKPLRSCSVPRTRLVRSRRALPCPQAGRPIIAA